MTTCTCVLLVFLTLWSLPFLAAWRGQEEPPAGTLNRMQTAGHRRPVFECFCLCLGGRCTMHPKQNAHDTHRFCMTCLPICREIIDGMCGCGCSSTSVVGHAWRVIVLCTQNTPRHHPAVFICFFYLFANLVTSDSLPSS